MARTVRARGETSRSGSAHWPNGVIPIAVKAVSPDIHLGELLIGDLDLGRVNAVVELRVHFQSPLCRRCGDQVDDHLVSDQRLASPV